MNKQFWVMGKFFIVLIIFSILFLNNPVFCEENSQGKEPQKSIRIWAGYNYYKMENFNDKLSCENNNTIDGGINIGIEFSNVKIKIPEKIPLIGGNPMSLPLIGIEYLSASSKTNHTGIGGSATVNWELPVTGIYLAPEIDFSESGGVKLNLRPIGVGYYMMGKLINAKLTVSDRPGSLEVFDETFGLLSQIGIKYNIQQCEFFITTAYRWLKFTDVSQEPNGGFTVTSGGPLAQPGNLPETIDYRL